MSTITIDLPDQLYREANELVESGCFQSPRDMLVTALAEFIRHYRPQLMDEFARQDIAWARKLTANEDRNR